MSLIVTATQGGSVANGMALRVYVLNNAAAVQNGGTSNNQFAAATSFTQSVTTSQAGSKVYGVSAVFANNSATAAAATTLVDNISDAVNNARYVTFKAAALTGTPGPTTLGFTVASSAGPFAQAEILPATGTLTEDNSAPAVVSVTGAEVASTAAFSPPSGSLLVALVASHGGVGTETMTVSGGGLKWTELVKNDPAGGDYAGVWIAQAPSPVSWTQASGRTMWSPGAPPQTFPLSITTTSLPNGTDGVPYSATVTATGGLPPYTWSVSAGTLPAWASLNASTGAITGTPSGVSATTSFTIEVTDSNLNTAAQAFSITTTGPAVPWQGPVQAKLPLPRRGKCRAILFVPLIQPNPQPGPVFVQAAEPVRARIPQNAPRGRINSNKGVRGVIPAVTPFFPQGLVRAKLPQQPFLKGRIASSPGAPLRNPQPGPVFFQAVRALRAELPLQPLLRGRVYSNAGVLKNPQPGPVFIQKPFPAKAARPLPSRGRVYGISRGALSNPQPGPVFYPAVQPVRAKLPQQPFLKGRVSSNPGAPLENPQPGPVFRQPVQVLRARTPLPARGRIGSNPGAAVPPAVIVPFRSATTPARIRPSLPLRGRIYFNSGAPVRDPQPGPKFTQATSPARARIPQVYSKGRIGSNPGTVVPPPLVAGPPFYPIRFPARARIPQDAPRGRVYSNKGAPVRNPQSGPFFRQATAPVQARHPLPPRGRISFNPGILQPIAVGPVFRQATEPVRARIPQVWSKGRISSNPGTSPQPPPVWIPWHGPVRIRPSLPPRGRSWSNQGTLAVPPGIGPRVYPQKGPARVHPVLPLRGRIAFNKGALVRNPQPGPVFRQAVHPIRGIIPQNAPRGRIGSNSGGPVENIPNITLIFRYGDPEFGWTYGAPEFEWAYNDPEFQWVLGPAEF